MASIELAESDLFAHRPATIGRMLATLRDRPVACSPFKYSVAGGRVLAAHGGIPSPTVDYSDWRFRTVAPQIECQYFELWKPTNVGRVFHLDRAYLHLFRINRKLRSSDELIAVHADPSDDTLEEPLRSYKQGLHLHVVCADHPIPKCHFPLVLSCLEDHLDTILASTANLTAVFCKVVEVVRHEFIRLFESVDD